MHKHLASGKARAALERNVAHSSCAKGIELHALFAEEFAAFSKLVKRELLSEVEFLEQFGPALSRPHADTLKNSKHANMKELRFNADDGVWRLAFAFDPERKAILLVAGDKSGASSQKFYPEVLQDVAQKGRPPF